MSYQKVFIIMFCLMALASPVRADLRWELQSTENQLTLNGSCDTDVHIELYESENFELDPLYTAVAPCVDGTFTHDDNLLKWGILDGQYKLVVESDRHTVRDFTIKEPPVTTEEALAREAREKGLPLEVGLSADQIFENAQASFGQKLYSLETDLITMQESLKDTTYPDFIKIGLGGALSGIETLTKKLGEAFFVVESRNFEEKNTSIESLPTLDTTTKQTTEPVIEKTEDTEVATPTPSEEVTEGAQTVTEEVVTPSE
ncbi:MAG: hypothetical protein KIH67_000280 [Candidatus Moranbacteria bacterium]|nr:hypothetical protein [Candidatus Moranbacteria bacterium]